MKSILPAAWAVPQRFRDRLGDGPGRQRAMESEGHLLLVLHQSPAVGESERTGRFFWRDPTGNWKATHGGSGIQALKNHVEEFDARVDRLEVSLAAAAGARDYYHILRELAPLTRTLRNMHKALQEARELCQQDRELIDVRDRAGEVERAAELLYHDAQASLSFHVAYHQELESQRTYEMTVASHRLNLLAALFFPVATMSAVFGMNLVHGLERAPGPRTFLMVLGGGLIAGCVLAFAVARRPRSVRPTPGQKYAPGARQQ